MSDISDNSINDSSSSDIFFSKNNFDTSKTDEISQGRFSRSRDVFPILSTSLPSCMPFVPTCCLFSFPPSFRNPYLASPSVNDRLDQLATLQGGVDDGKDVKGVVVVVVQTAFYPCSALNTTFHPHAPLSILPLPR